ncbi:unnamed protein product [Cylindrotheca closterium]|uniref:Uncharacterized protein n=1 Tax=Cylindrotheca closterium TaxID=2856 RepID=A0AAD2FPA2_9STRA|nr:unnamed protein product [Cylindrotheca closterium]
MGKSKNNKKVAIAAKAVTSSALTQGHISFLQKSRVETAKIRSKKESDNLDPPIANNNNDIDMEEVKHPLQYDRIVPNIDLSQWNLQTLAHLCTIHRYSENFVDPPATESWEEASEKLLQICDGDWNLVEQRIRAAHDRDIKDEFIGNDRELVVYVRGLILGLAVQDPLVIFPLDDPMEETTFFNRYWDFTLEVEPRLLLELRPLAKVWAIEVELLGHLWTDPDTTTVVTELAERRSAAKGRKRERNLDPSMERKSAPIDPRSPARGFFPDATPKPVRDSVAPNKDDSVMMDTTGPSVISPTNKPVNGKFAYCSDNDGSESIESAPDFSAPSNSDQPPTEVVVGKSPAPAQRANDPSTTVLFDSHLSKTEPPEPPRPSAPLSVKKQLTYVAASQKKTAIRTKYFSEEMKAREVTQMNLTGLPRSNAQFLCATINYEWNGDTSEGGSIEKCFTEEMVSVLSMAMDNAEGDLVILPVSELRVRDKKLWLTSKEKVEELTYKKLKPYIDWSWNNGARFGYNAKNPGSKTLRTRIRVAHNSSLDDMSRLLGQCFEITGTHAGVFRSPLQVSDPVRIGWLLNYPMGIGRAALERELMRHFTFKRAIALEPAWPQNPGTAGQKWMPSKGPKAWHIWVAASDVDRVARALFAWLRPETKKCHMPFGARTQFVYDWGAVTKGHLGDLAQPGGQWNGIIGKLINTHDTTSQTCTSLAPLFPIQGMLTKCIPAVKKPLPAQPEQSATQDADTPDSPSPPSVSSTPPDLTPTNSSVTAPTAAQPTLPAPSTKRSSRKRSKNRRAKQPLEKPTETPQATPPTPLPRPTPALKSTPQSATNPPTESSAWAKLSASEQPLVTEAFDRSAWLAAMDAELNQGPAGLFQMILPGPIDGFYVFVVRQKFA